MSFLDKGFHSWIREYGSEEDKDVLRGSGLPTPRDRILSKRAYAKYLKFLKKSGK